MILKLKLSDGSTLFVHREGEQVRLENYSNAGTPNSKCLWGHGITLEQAEELTRFLQSQGVAG